MRLSLITGLLILSGCCGKQYYNEAFYSTAIQLNINYGAQGFNFNDTVFNLTTYDYGSTYYNQMPYETYRQNDSQRILYLYNLDVRKVLIESLKTSFSDSLTDLGYNSKQVSGGNKRCGNERTKKFNIHATYRGQVLSSGDNSTLEINIIK